MLIRESDGEPMSVVSTNWAPTQNEEAFTIFEQIVERGKMEMTHLGSLREGRIVWSLAKTPWSFRASTDTVQSYVLMSNPHEYGRSMDARYMAVLPDMTTIVLPLEHGTLFTTHRSKLKDATINIVLRELRAAHDDMARHAAILVKNKFVGSSEFFTGVFGSAKPAAMALEIMSASKENTLWQAVKSTAHAIDYSLGYSPDTRMTSAWYGVNRAKKEKALRTAMQIASLS